MATELIYGYTMRGSGWRDPNAELSVEKIIDNLLEQHADGIYVIDQMPDDVTLDFAERCRDNKLDFILGFRWPQFGRNEVEGDYDLLKRAIGITRRLALGNVATHEWYGAPERSPRSGRRMARYYLRLQKKFNFEWVCCITHRTICHDIHDGMLLKATLGQTMCVCLCGYILAGYCYGDCRMPHQRQTSLGKQDLFARWGLNAYRLKQWLANTNCLTGGGTQKGIDGGSRVYAKQLGFGGMVIGSPFNLEGTLNVPILPEMTRPPKECGIWVDYQNPDVLLEDREQEWKAGCDW